MISITLDEIQRDLVSYFQRVRDGETFLVMEGDRPLAEIKPVSLSQQKKQPRPFGLCAGEFAVPDNFDEPLEFGNGELGMGNG